MGLLIAVVAVVAAVVYLAGYVHATWVWEQDREHLEAELERAWRSPRVLP